MRIAFVSGNLEHLPDPVIPIGVRYVMASTPAGHETILIDLCFSREPMKELGEKLGAFGPDVVAVGMRNIQNADYTSASDSLNHYAAVVDTVRATTTAKVVFGGGGFSVMPRELMGRLKPDYGISGEGEGSWPLLVRALEAGETNLSLIGSLHWYRDGVLVSNPAAPAFLDLDALEPPDRTLVDPRYFEEVGIVNVQTKRGCPLRCDYCTYPLIEGRAIRQRDPVKVVDEILRTREQHPGMNHVFFVDSVFNLPPKHAKAVCREMIARDCRVPWTCYANPIGFDAELAELMAEAGCAGMEIGSDSGVDEVLLRLKKGFTTERIRAMRALCRENSLRDCHTFILGTTGETLDDVHRTLDFIVDLDPFAAIMMIWIDDYESMDPGLAMQRLEFRDQIRELLGSKKKSFPRWIMPTHDVNFDKRLFKLLRRQGLTGPLWQHIGLVDTPDPKQLPRLGVTQA